MKKTLDFVEYDPEKEIRHYPRAFEPIMKKPMIKCSPILIRCKSPPTNLSRMLNPEKNTQTKRYSPRIDRIAANEDILKENKPPTNKCKANLFQDLGNKNKPVLTLNTENRVRLFPIPQADKNVVFLEKVKKGDIEEVISLLSKGAGKSANVNYKRSDGWTALHIACDDGNLKMVCTLLKLGAEIDATNIFKRTALHISCIKYKY